MLSVVILNNDEPNVIQLTWENLHRELTGIVGSELLLERNWLNAIPKIKNQYVCFVEADCLVSSGYFSSQLGLFQKNPHFRRLAMMGSATGINNWATRIYGYELTGVWSGPDSSGVQTKNPHINAISEKRSDIPYPIEIGYVAGAVIRMSILRSVMEKTKLHHTNDPVMLSSQLSLAFWRQSARVNINPNSTYVTTNESAKDPGDYNPKGDDLKKAFKKESI